MIKIISQDNTNIFYLSIPPLIGISVVLNFHNYKRYCNKLQNLQNKPYGIGSRSYWVVATN